MTDALTRFQQGIRALLAFTRQADHDLAASYLSPAQFTLFQQMSHTEQLHSLNVLRDVLAQSDETPADLAVAALLHDVGKMRYHMAVWQKVIVVLTEAFLPSVAREWSNTPDDMRFWRAPFVVRTHHPVWGADLLRDLDTSAAVIWLIEHHADNPEQWQPHPHCALLKRLKAADDAN